jgi:hypothetical protein
MLSLPMSLLTSLVFIGLLNPSALLVQQALQPEAVEFQSKEIQV